MQDIKCVMRRISITAGKMSRLCEWGILEIKTRLTSKRSRERIQWSLGSPHPVSDHLKYETAKSLGKLSHYFERATVVILCHRLMGIGLLCQEYSCVWSSLSLYSTFQIRSYLPPGLFTSYIGFDWIRLWGRGGWSQSLVGTRTTPITMLDSFYFMGRKPQ